MFDGVTSVTGVLAGLLVAHAAAATILASTAGLAVAASVGMAFGDYLGGAFRAQAAVMGAATAVGSILPALPFVLLPYPLGLWASGAVIALLTHTIVLLRPGPRLKACVTTWGTVCAASMLSVGVALVLGIAS